MDSLNAVLKREAVGLGLCEKWTKEWDHSYDDYEFCEKFKTGQDFCIKNEFPSVDFIKKYFDTSALSRFGVFVDSLFDGDGEPLRNGTYVCLGECEGTMVFPRWSSAVVYARHYSRLRIVAGEFSKITVRLYDDSEVEMVEKENSRVRICDRR